MLTYWHLVPILASVWWTPSVLQRCDHRQETAKRTPRRSAISGWTALLQWTLGCDIWGAIGMDVWILVYRYRRNSGPVVTSIQVECLLWRLDKFVTILQDYASEFQTLEPTTWCMLSLHTGQTLPGDFRVASSWVISHSRDTPTQQSFSKVSSSDWKQANFGSGLDSEMDGCWGGFLTWSNGQIRDFVGELEGFAVIWMFDSFDSMIFMKKRKRGSELYAEKGLVLDLLNYYDLIRGWNDLQWKAERNNSVGVRFEIPLDTSCRFAWICYDLFWLVAQVMTVFIQLGLVPPAEPAAQPHVPSITAQPSQSQQGCKPMRRTRSSTWTGHFKTILQ